MSRFLFLGLGLPGVGLLLAAATTLDDLPPVADLGLPLLGVLAFTLVNALFVAAEFSIMAVRDTQLEQMVDEGNPIAGNVLQILEIRPRLDHYIATAQLGVTLASLALAMVGMPVVGRFAEAYLLTLGGLSPTAATVLGYAISLALLTSLHVIVGEMTPKALALADPPGVALALDRLMRLTGSVFGAPARLLNGAGNVLLRLFRIPPAQVQTRLMAAEELELIVAESAEGGLIEDEEQEIIRNIFDFSERTAGQVMTPRRKVQALAVTCGREELIRTVTESRHSRFPVYEGDPDHIVGILHLKDLIQATLRPSGPFNLHSLLRAAREVPQDFPVDRLLAAFKNERMHMAIVRDEFGGLAGIVTLEDLVEEVVGEVRDEFDIEREPYTRIAPGALELSGDYLLADLGDEVDLGREEERPDVETVGGLIVALLGRPPVNGDTVTFRDTIRFTVLDIDRLAVTYARVEYPPADEGRTGNDGGNTEEE